MQDLLVAGENIIAFLCVRSYWNISHRKFAAPELSTVYDHELFFVWLQVAMKSSFAC